MSPEAPEPLATRADLEACHAAIRVGSRTFHAASRLLPERVRGPALSLYAFCREADDAIDQSGDPRAALRSLEDRLDRAYRREPIDNAADRALAEHEKSGDGTPDVGVCRAELVDVDADGCRDGGGPEGPAAVGAYR